MHFPRLQQLWHQIASHRTRLGVVVSVLAVGLLLWGRLILLDRVPRIATADPDAKQSAPAEAEPSEQDDQASDVRYLPDRHNPTRSENSEPDGVQTPAAPVEITQGPSE